jgi:hypothetical protein
MPRKSGKGYHRVGAVSELFVASDLLKKGFEVYRSMSGGGCDLVVIRTDGLVERIEVKTGYRTSKGLLSYPHGHVGMFDIMAVVVEGEGVVYLNASEVNHGKNKGGVRRGKARTIPYS